MAGSAYDASDPSADVDVFAGADERPPDHKDPGDAGPSGGDNAYGSSPVDQLAIKRALAPIPDGGPLLEEPSAQKLFRLIDKEVVRQEPLAKNRDEQRRHWEYVRAGAQFSILEKNEDLAVYKQVFPPGLESSPNPVPNKVADLCDKIISQILVDPPLPDPSLDDPDDDRQRAATDLTRRFLRANGTPAGTNDLEAWRQCLNINITQKSAFIYAYVDDKGGGWRPKQIRANPAALDPRMPFMGADGTSEGDRVLRYVSSGQSQQAQQQGPDSENADDGAPTAAGDAGGAGGPGGPAPMQFVEDAAAADRQWMPKIVRRILTPAMVRTYPKHLPVAEARGVCLLLWTTLGEAKRLFPVLQTVGDGKVRTLCAWKPKRWQAIVPEAMRAKGGAGDGMGEITDDTLFFWYHRFCRSDEDYPDGAEVAITGGDSGFLLRRDTLREDVELDNGTKVPVVKDVPVAQFIALQDPKKGDPFGREPIEKFSGSSEIHAHLWLGILTALEKGLNPIPFIPSTSPVSKEDMTRRDGRPVEVLSKDDMPAWEQPPSLPSFVMDALNQIEVNMNSEAGTNETSNNLDSKYAVSGVAKNVAIRQAKVSLAQYWQNTAAGITRTWQIYAQLAMAHYTIPQQAMLSGTGAYKRKWWVGSDLNGVSEIAIDSGSFTMMAPGEKLALLQTQQANQWISVEEAAEAARTVMADDLGMQDSPHAEHIDQQLAEWADGPPPEFQRIQAQNQQQAQQVQQQVQQMTTQLTMTHGIPAPQAQAIAMKQVPKPPAIPLPTAFPPRPNDAEPGVALIRARKLSRFMATPEYGRQPAEWRADLDKAWWTAFQASGGQTVQMQQESQQAAAAPAKPADDGKADQTYQQFLTDITNKVLGTATTSIAKEVAAATGLAVPPSGGVAGAENAQAAQAAAAQAQQAQLDAHVQLAGDQAKATGVLQNAREQRAHDAAQADKDRAHEHLMAAQSHVHALDKSATEHAMNPPPPPDLSVGQGAVQPTVPGLGLAPTAPGAIPT